MARTPLLAALALLTAGCASPEEGDHPADRTPTPVDAPWWTVGEYWEVSVDHAGKKGAVRLVNFLNQSDHFWLGVTDRAAALDHALHDTNPLLGRIHHGLLTPHEGGIHATGLYTFPIEVGDAWQGIAFGRTWNLAADEGDRAGAVRITGSSPDGATIAYDYNPATRWFTFIEIRKSGAVESRFDVADHGTGATGKYWFFRGRDYYELGASEGSTFDVPKEEAPVGSLYVEFDGTVSGPISGTSIIELVDPAGTVRHRETVATGGTLRKSVEIPNPAQGTWTIKQTGTGTFDGRLDVTGLLTYTATLG